MFGKKRKISLVNGAEICDKASKFTDLGSGNIAYKGSFFEKTQYFKESHVVQDEQGWWVACPLKNNNQ